MTIAAERGRIAWWKEPTREQWHAWTAAWLGWTLDAFDFTIFLLLMLPISRSFHVPLVGPVDCGNNEQYAKAAAED